MEVGVVAALTSTDGARALATADRVLAEGADPLRAATQLRQAGIEPELAGAALTQAALRRKAAGKFGPDAERLYFTPAGLEQATRSVVAARRARRLAEAGVRTVADLGCGIGADAIAFARAGLRVLAVEKDPATAQIAEANLTALGLADRVEVRWADATQVDMSTVDAVFADPARREITGGRRVFDPDAYSPPWSFVTALADRVPATVLKVAPGIDHARIPSTVEAEWVSVGGDVVEAALWFGPLAQVPRRATLVRGDRVDVLTGVGEDAPVGPLGRYVFDPDGAVVRSHLVAEFAATVGGRLADPHIAYVFADEPSDTPFAPCFEVISELPYPYKQLRAALRDRGVGQLEIRKRGLAVEPDRLRRDLRLAGPAAATLILARINETPIALLCRRADGAPGPAGPTR